jgi:acetylglutamate kinase
MARPTNNPAARAASLVEALPYIQKFRGQIFVIKYGGSAMEDEQQVERLLRDVVFLEAVGINPVIVHGGGKAISAKMREAGIAPRFVNGLRVTEEMSVKIVEETLDGEINPGIVSLIHEHGGKALGLSGKTVFVSSKLPPQRLDDGSEADLGFVGEAVKVSTKDVLAAVKNEIVPVISPIGATAEGQVLNINADVAAAALAAGLKAHKLIFVSDVAGIMRNPSQPDTLIPTVTIQQTKMLIETKVIDGGMIPKVESAVRALEKGVEKIHMIGGHIAHCLLLEIFTNAGIGTEIVR